MAPKKLDVVGIGNAIVDILATTSSAFLEEQGLPKGGMQLVDDATAKRLYDAMGPATETSGGSAANTIAGLASLGAKCAFLGKTRDDELGEVFRHDIRAQGVHFPTEALDAGPRMDLSACGALGSLCAAEAISHFGARPQSSLKALAATHGIYPPRT